MSRYLIIDLKRCAWRDILALYRARRQPALAPSTLFGLKEDTRPPSHRSAAGRYAEPMLFDGDMP